MTTPLNELPDDDLIEAEKKLAKLTCQVGREAAENPGCGWAPVIDLLEEGWQKLGAEKKRRGLE